MGEVKRPTRDDHRELGRGHTTMERRKFVVGLGALASGSAAAMGTGAFDQVRADRDFTVEAVGDSSAYVGFKSGTADDTTTSPYAKVTNETLAINFSGGLPEQGSNATGVNKNADSVFENVFTIVNNGTQDVTVLPVDTRNATDRWSNDLPAMYWSEDSNPELNDKHDFSDTPTLTPGDSITISIIFWDLAASPPIGRYNKTNMSKAESQGFIGFMVSDA